MARPVSIGEIIEGSLGFFWPFNQTIPNLQAEPERGYAHRDDGWVIIETLDENVTQSFSARRAEESPEAIAALMPKNSALFLEVLGAGWTNRSGYRASSKRYRARTAIGNVQFDKLRSSKLRAIHVNFHGIAEWAGLSATDERRETDGEGKLTSWAITLKSTDKLTHRITQARDIVLSTTWSVDGEEDKRILSAPVTVGCSSLRPRDIWELLQPILHVQDLINLAWEGFTAASGGSVNLDLKKSDEDPHSSRPDLWNGALMVPLPGVRAPKSMTEFPLFDLAAIGGTAGLARWIRLCDTYPRAIGPVVNRYRRGAMSAEMSLLEVAAGIEYWVKSNRPAVWTKNKFTDALANRVGSPFTQWVGDPQLWGADFWGTYNKLKHETTYRVDPYKVSDLAQSGHLLLTAALLNRVAGTKLPSRQLFHSHKVNSLGARLRAQYAHT